MQMDEDDIALSISFAADHVMNGGRPPARIRENVFTLYRPQDQQRLALPDEIKGFVKKYGRPGHYKARSATRGVAVLEVRSYDFSKRFDAPEEVKRRIRGFIRCPAWVLIETSGGSVNQPVTGNWVYRDEGEDEYERIAKLPLVDWYGAKR